MNFNWQKITWVSLIISIFFLLTSFLFWYKMDSFCYAGHYDCMDTLKYGYALTLIQILPFTVGSLVIILLFTKKYKKILYIFTFLITISLIFFVFTLPVECGFGICGDRSTGSLLLRNLYPIILIPTALIMWIYFKIKDYKEKLNQLK